MTNWVLSDHYTLLVFGGAADAQGRYHIELAHRHPLNNRRQEAVVLKYARLMLKDGLVAAFRGRPVAVCGDDADGVAPEHQQNLMMGGASVVEAVKVAKKLEPDNQEVVRSVDAFIDCITFFWKYVRSYAPEKDVMIRYMMI